MIIINGEKYEGVAAVKVKDGVGFAFGMDEKHKTYAVLFKPEQLDEMCIECRDADAYFKAAKECCGEVDEEALLRELTSAAETIAKNYEEAEDEH